MTPEQETNVLKWVEAMLSGQYKHGVGVLHNVYTNCHCALGVAADVFGCEYAGTAQTLDGKYTGTVYRFPSGLESHVAVSPEWHAQTFGVPRDYAVYSAVNDRSKDYLPVVALLLNSVPDSRKRTMLKAKFDEAVEVANANVPAVS